MEMIFGVIEDLIDKFQGGDPDQKEDAKNSLKVHYDEYVANLEGMPDNPTAQDLLAKLKGLNLD